MSIDLSPEVERKLHEYAAREGVSASEYVARLLQSAISDTPRDPVAHVQTLLTQWQQEYGLPVPSGGYKSTAELFAAWDAEDAQMTEEEREEERRFWADYERERDRRPVQI
jgi:hypothetical protein